MDAPLSNTVGTVLDPVFSIRRQVLFKPGTTVRISFWTVVGKDREACWRRSSKYNDTAAFDRAATLAWTHAQVQLRHIDLTSAEASLFQRLAACVLFPERELRAPDNVSRIRPSNSEIFGSTAFQATCRSCSSALTRMRTSILARELVLAHEYLRLKRLSFDLVILNERGSSYAQDLQQALEAMARISETVCTL